MTTTSCAFSAESPDIVVTSARNDKESSVEQSPSGLSPWATGVALVLAASVVQRVVGFVRAAWFCRWLDAEQLGTWDLAFSFLMTATPLVVLALPGCLGRYVEHFHKKGTLGSFLRRVALIQGTLAVLAAAAMVIFAQPTAEMIFGSAAFSSDVYLLAFGLIVIAWFNFLYELTTALRLSRWIAALQLANSILFAVFGIGLLWLWRRSAESIMIAYLLACGVTIIWAFFVVRPWLLAGDSGETTEAVERYWPKILWYSLGLWATGTVGNLFAVADRYMIIHLSPAGVNSALAQVGDYHAARLIPVLLVSLAGLVAALSVPHLSHAWEQDRRDWCVKQLEFLVKISGLALMVVSTGVLLGRSVIFDLLLAGKYPAAQSILPLTLLVSCWFALFLILQSYVLCCEKVHWAALAMTAGLAVNIVLNAFWLPIWGLSGAVAATAVANGLALALLAVVSQRLGLSFRLSVVGMMIAPLGLVGGLWLATVLTVALVALAGWTPFFFSREEKREILLSCQYLGRLWQSLRPPAAPHKTESVCTNGLSHKGCDTRCDREMRRFQPAFAGNAGRVWPNPFFRRRRHPPLGQRGPLRVMFVITCMPVGGAERLLVDIVRRLDRRIIQPELCCLKYLGPLGEVLAKEDPAFTGLLSHKYDLRVLPRLCRLMRKREIDAVITVGTGGDKMFWGRLAAYIAGVPVIASALHSTGLPDHVEWLNRILAPLTDAFIAVARPHAEYLVSNEGCPRDRTYIITNGVDTGRFCPRPPDPGLREELGLPPDSPVLAIVAALRPEKNHELFLKAAAIIHNRREDVHFLIVGDGPRRPALEGLAAEFGLEKVVHFLGTRHDIPDILACTDVVVLSSHMEANPLSVLEAMACGKPVVATRVGSVPTNVIDGLTGFLVPPGDATALVDRCLLLLSSAELREEMGRAGRQHVSARASLDTTVGGYQDLIVEMYRCKCGRIAKMGEQETTFRWSGVASSGFPNLESSPVG